MRFLLLFIGNEDEWRALPQSEISDAGRRIGRWYAEHAGAGRIVHGGRLAEKARAKAIRLGSAGKTGMPEVADGPFFQGNESAGSFAVVEAASLDEAVEIASGWPGGGAVEVRPLVEG